ncbi:BrxE family protein [Desulfobacterium sp. N47]|uniref:BrxE family protein n=1 Tax=uncultured Desulfobacterium sp. TaxID=201089 RepID=E1Y8A4_9BACT|nr:hypothetical protein N47_A08270 [uncultured Desulfobacterium sp.]
MKKEVLQDIFLLRMCIGYLGETDQYSWWSSSFFSPISSAFLSPVFSKTGFATQYHGVREAATIVHDEHIGIGKGVFHLFRLPETHEIEMHHLLDNPDVIILVQNVIKSMNAAEQFVSEFGQDNVEQTVGPHRLGDNYNILIPKTWKIVAGQYASAFKNNKNTYPYFTTS